MGRKPNPIILEYFSRGAKLEDASNRYEHTCKLCGETFPKGRIDSLVAHLTKKCNSISLPERTKVVLRLHDLGDPDASPNKTSGGNQLEQGKHVDLPYSPTKPQNFNGLNVLAEASRRVGATDRPGGRRNNHASRHEQGSLPLDPALGVANLHGGLMDGADETFEQGDKGKSGLSRLCRKDTNHATRKVGPTIPPLTSIYTYLPVRQGDGQDEPANFPDLSYPANSNGPPLTSQLSSIAASAQETLANGMLPAISDAEIMGDNISAQLFNSLNRYNDFSNGQHSGFSKPPDNWPAFTQDAASEESTQVPQDAVPQQRDTSSSVPRPITINPLSRPTHFVTESGTSLKAQKPKVRGRFTPDRRKEVQDVRKSGACLRCRMLKKPCSPGTPCATCQSVESARLWKQPCIRTRIAEEFTLFSAGLHSTLAFHDINNIRSKIKFEALSGTIRSSFFDSMIQSIGFDGIKGESDVHAAGLSSSAAASADDGGTAIDIFLLDADGESMIAKVERYIRDTIESVATLETSAFLRNTVLFAWRLGQEKEDTLLKKVCELWTATKSLSDSGLKWIIALDDGSVSDSSESQPVLINEKTNAYSYALMCSQLRAAVEKQASVLAKYVMNEIERRLLQRQQSGRFETFLAAVIFLNCAERLCWLFLTWDVDLNQPTRWPLDKRPRPYAEQGEKLADILNMLLKMRSLANKCRPRVGDGVLEPVDDEGGLATEWFGQIAITQSFLDDSSTAQFDVRSSHSMDGKLFARILQPQACYT